MDKALVVLTCIFTLIANTPYHTIKWAFFAVVSTFVTIAYT